MLQFIYQFGELKSILSDAQVSREWAEQRGEGASERARARKRERDTHGRMLECYIVTFVEG